MCIMGTLKEKIMDAESRLLYLKQKVANQEEYLVHLYRLRANCVHEWKEDFFGAFCTKCGEVG